MVFIEVNKESISKGTSHTAMLWTQWILCELWAQWVMKIPQCYELSHNTAVWNASLETTVNRQGMTDKMANNHIHKPRPGLAFTWWSLGCLASLTDSGFHPLCNWRKVCYIKPVTVLYHLKSLLRTCTLCFLYDSAVGTELLTCRVRCCYYTDWHILS